MANIQLQHILRARRADLASRDMTDTKSGLLFPGEKVQSQSDAIIFVAMNSNNGAQTNE
jgi:hypothetical protein